MNLTLNYDPFWSFLFLNNIIPITNFQISGFLIFHQQKVTRTSDVMAAKSLVVVAVNDTRPKNYRTIRVLGTRLSWASFLSLGVGRIPLTMFLTMSPVPINIPRIYVATRRHHLHPACLPPVIQQCYGTAFTINVFLQPAM